MRPTSVACTLPLQGFRILPNSSPSINLLIDINSYLIDSFTPKDDKLCGGIDGNQCPRALSE